MCGICGAFDLAGGGPGPSRELVRRMSDALRHRGPDDEGVFVGDGAALGFRRLAILDLSREGNQPFVVGDRVVAVLNGEIYNHRELRRELERDGVVFRSTCDAEVVPHLYLRDGPAFVERLQGMFALAVFDRRERRLLLARDRFGKKPLYYRVTRAAAAGPDGSPGGEERLEFASEPKALLAGGAAPPPDPASLVRFLTFGYVPGEHSAFTGFRRVPPGARLLAGPDGVRVERYYTPPEPAPRSGASDLPIGEWKARALDALVRAVERRLQADVPIGVFLSGGIDSGLILAALCRLGAGVPRTFTIGFDDPRYDERDLAAETARHLGLDPTVLVARPIAAHALAEIVRVFDEPFGDPSAYPTLVVSRLAREHVTVALSGDGGDEVFGGYRRHAALGLADDVARATPGALRRLLSRMMGEAANGTGGRGALGELRRFAAAVGMEPATRNAFWSSFFRAPLRVRFLHPDLLARAGDVDPEAETEGAFHDVRASALRRAMRHDLRRYLPDDLLVKTDTASMSCSLEVRAPFLDPELVALAAELPDELLIRGRETKVLLRALARDLLPPRVAAARKRGFGVPLAAWLRGPLRSTVETWLLGERFAARGVLRPGAAAELVARHESGREDWSGYLWLLLVLEAWFRRHVDGEDPPDPAVGENREDRAPGERREERAA